MAKQITSISLPPELLCRVDALCDRFGEFGPRPSRNSMITHLLGEALALIDAPEHEPSARPKPEPKTVRHGHGRVRERVRPKDAA